MAEYYRKEASDTGHYLLEDSSGSLLLEVFGDSVTAQRISMIAPESRTVLIANEGGIGATVASFVTFFKDVNAVLDYTFDWGRWLGTDTISTSTWTVASGLTQATSSNTTTTSTVWLSGGTTDTDYTVANRIVTAAGRTEDRTMTISVRSR